MTTPPLDPVERGRPVPCYGFRFFVGVGGAFLVGVGGAFFVGVTVGIMVETGVLVATGVCVGIGVAGSSGSAMPFRRNQTVALLCAFCASET